jgi:hypothetical protein
VSPSTSPTLIPARFLGAVPSPVALFTAADGRVAGLRLRDGGEFTRIRPAVYARTAEWSRLPPWSRYLARVHAFALTHPGVVFALESAAVLQGLPLFGESTHIHVFDPVRGRARRFGDVVVHTTRDAPVIVSRDGLLMMDAATTAVDLLRVLPPAFGLAVADAVISPKQLGVASADDLHRIADSQSTTRGNRRVATLLELADGRSESPGESVSRAVIHWSGFEPPELQREFITDGITDRVDFAWPRVRAIGESDGYGKYRGESLDDTVARVVREKQREDRLRRSCRAFRRWDWGDAMAVVPLQQRLVEMQIPRVARPQAALLATLASNPRSLPRVAR